MKVVEDGRIVSAPENIDEADISQRVARMEAARSIEDLLSFYAWSVDKKDAAGITSLFCENGGFYGPGFDPIMGPDHIGRLYGHLLGEIKTSSHLIGPVQVHFIDEGHATAHTAFHAFDSYLPKVDSNECKPDCYSFGWYEAKAQKCADGEWRLLAFGVYFSRQLTIESKLDGRGEEQFEASWPPFE